VLAGLILGRIGIWLVAKGECALSDAEKPGPVTVGAHA